MIYHNNPSDRWDNKEHKMDEADMQPEEGPKVEVQVNTGQADNEMPLSGIFCVWCNDVAIKIFEGNSLCYECFNKEIADRIKQQKK